MPNLDQMTKLTQESYAKYNFFYSFQILNIIKCSHSNNICYNARLAINFISRNGPIAQLVEQRIENPRVTGSIPVRATKYNKAHSDVGFFIA